MTEDTLVILFSKSPRRLELLSKLGFSVKALASDFDEVLRNGELPSDYALRNAEGKLACGTSKLLGFDTAKRVHLAADTIVVSSIGVLEKPKDADHARRMLEAIKGTEHDVITGVALKYFDSVGAPAGEDSFTVVTKVELIDIPEGFIETYLTSDEWRDKAGGYGIQGFIGGFVKAISGSYSNVVGLPTGQVIESMRKFNYL